MQILRACHDKKVKEDNTIISNILSSIIEDKVFGSEQKSRYKA